MNTINPLIKPLVSHLHDAGRLRVWSLVISILGDVAHPRGGSISMADLLTITDHMQIDQGAIRTALSRLSKEEWVTSKKSGRTSSYAFSAGGRAAFEPASARVYAPHYALDATDWMLAILPPVRAKDRQALQKILSDTSALQTLSGVAMWPQADAPKSGFLEQLGCLSFKGQLDRVPDWVKTECAPPEAEAMAQRFLGKFSALSKVQCDLTPLDAMVARILILHDWRRILLRYPIVPKPLQPTIWSMPEAHALMARTYKELSPISEHYWPTPLTAKGEKIMDNRF